MKPLKFIPLTVYLGFFSLTVFSASSPLTLTSVGNSGFTFSTTVPQFTYTMASVASITPNASISSASSYRQGPGGRLLFNVSQTDPRTFSIYGMTGQVIVEGCLNGSALPGASCRKETFDVINHNVSVGSVTSNATGTQLPFAYTTDNNGIDWSQPIFLPSSINGTIITNVQLNSVTCSKDGLKCIAGGSFTYDPSDLNATTPVIYRSEDGGKNWGSPIPLAYPDVSTSYRLTLVQYVVCSSSGHSCLALGSSTITEGGIENTRTLSYVSSDGGQTWSSQPEIVQQPENYFTTVIFSASCDDSGMHCIGAGYGQKQSNEWIPLTYDTEDGGATWRGPILVKNTPGSFAILYGISCSSDLQTCNAVGFWQLGTGDVSMVPVVYQTTTGGKTPDAWIEKVLPPPSGADSSRFVSVSCDAQGVVCVGVGRSSDVSGINSPLAYYTSNSGASWNIVTSFVLPPGTTESQLNSIACNDAGGVCLAIGNANTEDLVFYPYSYTSFDGGKTWQRPVRLSVSRLANEESGSAFRSVQGAR